MSVTVTGRKQDRIWRAVSLDYCSQQKFIATQREDEKGEVDGHVGRSKYRC